MSGHTFMMLFDETATPMLEAVMASGMAFRFPACKFELRHTRNPDFADIIIPIADTKLTGGAHDEFIMGSPPANLTSEVQDAFSGLLREAREARPS